MTTQSNIDYRITQAQKYLGHKGHGFKQINKLNQKSNEFKFQSAQDQFQIQIIFRTPAIINTVEIKIKQVDQVVVEMWNLGERVLVEREHFQEQGNVYRMRVIKLGDKSQRFDKAIVRFLNLHEPKKTQINYILFKGFKEEGTNKKNNIPKNFSQKDVFEPASKKKVIDEEKKVFQNRNKIKKTPVQVLVAQVITDRHIKKSIKDEDAQLRRALQLSKREQQQRQKSTAKKKKPQNSQQNLDQYTYAHLQKNSQIEMIPQTQQNEFFDYQVVQWQKVKKVYEHVTPQWLQAQRKAQRELGIQPRHSIANKVKVKIFKDCQFCVSNVVGSQKMRLVDRIKEVGGKCVDQPTNGCFVVTNKMEGAKVNFGLKLTGVKFVKPQYIQDCHKLQAKLDQKQYKP